MMLIIVVVLVAFIWGFLGGSIAMAARIGFYGWRPISSTELRTIPRLAWHTFVANLRGQGWIR